MKTLFISLFIFFLSTLLNAQITPWEAASLMQKGINLGNTLEPPDEGGWNNGPVQEYYFDMYRDAGFQTVRVPVRWDEHTQTSPPYHIDDAWMNRVEQVIDWGLSRGLFIVVNAHHEEWIKSGYDDPANRARFDSIWSQIAVRFKDKSEKLLFEIINEPYGLSKAQNDDLHQRVLSIIRKTNPTRIVIFQGHNWGGSDELIQAAIPDDPYIMGSFHSYDPYLFGLEGEGTWGSTGDYTTLRNKFISVKNWSDANNIPVFLGEFGSLKSCDYNSRMRHYRAYVEYSQMYGFVCCAWDDGGDFRIMERSAHKWDEVKDILIHTNSSAPIPKTPELFQDTIAHVSWSNPVDDYDNIYLQRRTASTGWQNLVTLSGDRSDYYDSNVSENVYYYYRIIGHYNDRDDLFSQPSRVLVPFYVPKVRKPYPTYAAMVPGIVEAENFDVGGEGFSYHDADQMNIPGAYRPYEGVDIYKINDTVFHIGYAYPGEWYEYSIVAEKAGEYTIRTVVTALSDGGSFKLSTGDEETEDLTVRSGGGWFDTLSVPAVLNLIEGEQIFRFTVISEPQFHIDKFIFTYNDNDKTSVPEAITEGHELRVFQDQSMNLVIRLENGSEIDRLEIYNLKGTLLFQTGKTGTEYSLPAGTLPSGFYIIRVLTPEEILNRKAFVHQ